MANPDLKFDTNTELAARRTGMSFQRTRMSADRTLMSVIRTSLSLIGFGFTIFQFFGRLNTTAGVATPVYPRAPQYLALELIGAGTIGLLIAAWEYHATARYLWSTEFKPIAGIPSIRHTPILGMSILLALIGVFAFAAVLFRVP